MPNLIRFFISIFASLILLTLLWLSAPVVEAAVGTDLPSPTHLADNPTLPGIRGLAACSTNIIVANANDSGAGSLRQALTDVCSGGTVDFAAGLSNKTITLTSAELSITKTVTITNPNAAGLKVSGNNARRVFNIQAGAVVTISNLSIINGKADAGGGIYNASTLTINNCDFRGNSAFYGGGIYNYSYSGPLTLNNSFLTYNSADYYGGGIFNNYGPVIINNSTIADNKSLQGVNGGGGGISNFYFGTMTINASTISYNTANLLGGGIYNGGELTLNNSTLSGNSGYEGGGIRNDGTLSVTNSTLNNNSATFGGGIYNYRILHLRNSIIANSPRGKDCRNNDTIQTNLKTLIEDGSCKPAFKGDPNLGPLTINVPGKTATHALIYPSKAIDAADSATCAAAPLNNRDQRGIIRPVDGNNDGQATCDIGAFELKPLPIVQFSEAMYINDENIGTSQSITLIRTGEVNMTAQVQVSLDDGTASPGVDYDDSGFPIVITFGNGVTSQKIPVPIIDDALEEQVESIKLTMIDFNNYTVIGSQDKTGITIVDDESPFPWGFYLPSVLK